MKKFLIKASWTIDGYAIVEAEDATEAKDIGHMMILSDYQQDYLAGSLDILSVEEVES